MLQAAGLSSVDDVSRGLQQGCDQLVKMLDTALLLQHSTAFPEAVAHWVNICNCCTPQGNTGAGTGGQFC
jgi:hypothetical protein